MRDAARLAAGGRIFVHTLGHIPGAAEPGCIRMSGLMAIEEGSKMFRVAGHHRDEAPAVLAGQPSQLPTGM
jgi:hypothetical protein